MFEEQTLSEIEKQALNSLLGKIQLTQNEFHLTAVCSEDKDRVLMVQLFYQLGKHKRSIKVRLKKHLSFQAKAEELINKLSKDISESLLSTMLTKEILQRLVLKE